MKLNKIIDNSTNTNNFSLYDRPEILTAEVAKDLNTYRNWSLFGLQVEPIFDRDKYKKDKNGNVISVEKDPGTDPDNWWNADGKHKFVGTKALFNNVNAVIWNDGTKESATQRLANNAPLLDSQQVRAILRERGGCSISDLVEASERGLMGRAIYNYSDFMYCKHLGKISNNYLITLRRFPVPCGDHINFSSYENDMHSSSMQDVINSNEYKANSHAPDQGRLVTWLGTPGNSINDILKYSVLMPYQEMNASVQEMNGTAETSGTLGSILNMANPSYVKGAYEGYAGTNAINTLQRGLGNSKLGGAFGKYFKAPQDGDWAYHRDQSKPYGPVDVISQTHIRKGAGDGGGGLQFEQNFNLTFDYELRSFDGINTRAAFLDLLSNILAVTYTNGKFWGGGFRSNGASNSSVFTNLDIFNMKSPMGFNQIKDATLNSISQMATAMNGGNKVSSFKDIIGMAKNMMSNIGNILVGGALNALGRPQKQGLNSLLTNDPVGLWHVTVGNPKHPIMSMGNMILTSVEVQQYGPLGLDDFPTGIKVTVGLKHAMPRDRMRIEQMYMMGDSRTYMPVGKNIEMMYESATEMKGYVNREDDVANSQAGTGTSESNKSGMKPVFTTEAKADAKEINARYMKYFGTVNRKMILVNAKEGHLGSSKAKTQEQANAELEEANRLQQQNSTGTGAGEHVING